MEDINVTEKEKMLLKYISEFVEIVSYCVEKQLGRSASGNRYAIEKPILCKRLDKFKYQQSAIKLALWKSMGWIDADECGFTTRVYLGNNKYKRMIAVNLSIQETLKRFY